MRNSEKFIMGLALLLIAAIGVVMYFATVECRKKGGTMLRDGYCVKNEAIL